MEPLAPGALRNRFVGGALEAASHILSSASAGVFVVGLVGPYIAALDAPHGMPPTTILTVAAVALVFSMAAGVGAVLLRGLGHCASHDVLWRKPRRGASNSTLSDGDVR